MGLTRMDQPSLEDLLDAHHCFPGPFHIKAIGSAADGFEERVVAAVASALADRADLEYTARATPNGRHLALTLVFQARSADHVREVYALVREQPGLSYLL